MRGASASTFPMTGIRLCTNCLLCWLLAVSGLHAEEVNLAVDDESPTVEFASTEIREALRGKGHRVKQTGLARLNDAGDGVCIVLSVRSNAEVARRMQAEGKTRPDKMKAEIPMFVMPRRRTLSRCGISTSGETTSITWLAIDTTSSPCGVSIRFRPWSECRTIPRWLWRM